MLCHCNLNLKEKHKWLHSAYNTAMVCQIVCILTWGCRYIYSPTEWYWFYWPTVYTFLLSCPNNYLYLTKNDFLIFCVRVICYCLWFCCVCKGKPIDCNERLSSWYSLLSDQIWRRQFKNWIPWFRQYGFTVGQSTFKIWSWPDRLE